MITIALLLSTLALSQEPATTATSPMVTTCELATGPVSATMRLVSIGTQTYAVRGAYARGTFEAKLRTCGMNDAAKHFVGWRTARRMTNITGVVGTVVFWPLLIATPIDAALAGARKNAMVAAIEAKR